MDRHELRTLRALFAHPLEHGVHGAEAEALCRALGAEVERLDGHRLRIRMPAGQETWIRVGSGVHHPDLDSEAVMRLRRLLMEAGVAPDHPQAAPASPRGDIARRLVLVLEHEASRAYRLDGSSVDVAELRPHGLWGSGENLTHRHDRDIAGQRAPVDHAYLETLAEAMVEADAVLLIGHGQGESDLRRQLLHYLELHHRELLGRIAGQVTLDTGGLSDRALLAVAREQFGNQPHRRPLQIPGQELRPG